jgi:hypothetical protein
MPDVLVLITKNEVAETVQWKCPVCSWHAVEINSKVPQKNWTWNGNIYLPSISPSVNAWLNKIDSKNHNPDFIINRNGVDYRELHCHFHIEDGKIRFCDDCNHEYAGKTIPMIPYTEAEVACHRTDGNYT